ncbi:MAG: iron-containing alcohol dehydrogenase [Rhodospirillales bacterium]|nr:iron-containing alcohol dehydrogenase [Rhodospirillales bacterium]MSP79786.1 iron-containing alcohol dehydrogenase [Rhodospirillales bacterium]
MSDTPSFIGNWNYPTKVRFGAGRIKELPRACEALGIERPLIVTDPGLAKLPMIAAAVDSLKKAGLAPAVFSAVQGNPVGRNVDDGVVAYRHGNHDGVIAFGGGSALDAGKAVALMAGQTRPLWDFEDVGDNWKRVNEKGIAPVVSVPTTSGTGSEVGRASVIVDEATHTKKIIFHPGMMPGQVVADPELTVGLPAHITAATGMDAFAHCLEAFCAPGFHPLADGIALEGMRLVREYLPRAVRDGSDLAARAHMMAAAAMGATAFQKGLGAIHSLSHPVGAVYNSHHGLTNAVFMPYVLAFNRPAIAERIAAVARYIDLPKPTFDGFLEWVLELRREFKIPHTCRELGVEESRLDELSVMAANDPTAGGNPISLDAAKLKGLFQAALAGKV